MVHTYDVCKILTQLERTLPFHEYPLHRECSSLVVWENKYVNTICSATENSILLSVLPIK